MEPATFFSGHPLGEAAFARVSGMLEGIGDFEVRTTKSQVAFRRRRAFAWLWLPGRWLRHPDADVVLSIALPRLDGSARWKEVVHPTARSWMHHLELRDAAELDEQVAGWLAEAWAAAA